MNDPKILDFLEKRSVGFARVCGIEYVEASQGHCLVSMHMEERFKNPQGFAHGGLLATLMDVAGGSAGLFAHGEARPIVTQSCDIHYLRPVSGPLVLAEGICLKAGRRSAIVQVNVRQNEDERLCATGIFEICYTDI